MKAKCRAVAFAMYILVLLRLTVFRNNFSFDNLLEGELNLIPFLDLIRTYQADFMDFIYLFLGNIITFIPLGYFLGRFERIQLYKVIIIGFSISFFIEIMQFVFAVGISETDDIILNTVGVLIGGALALKCEKRSRE